MVSVKKILLITTLSLAALFIAANFSLAADPATAGCTIEGNPAREICKLENPLQNGTEVTAIIGTIIKAALGIVGALTLLMLVWGGFQWLTSAGNPEKVKMGTQTMVWAIIGVLLVFASYLLLSTFTDYLTGQ